MPWGLPEKLLELWVAFSFILEIFRRNLILHEDTSAFLRDLLFVLLCTLDSIGLQQRMWSQQHFQEQSLNCWLGKEKSSTRIRRWSNAAAFHWGRGEREMSAFKPRQASADLPTLFIRAEGTKTASVPPNKHLGSLIQLRGEGRRALGLLYNTAATSKEFSLLSFCGGLMYILENINV